MKKIICSAVSVIALSSPALAAEHFKAGDILVRARAVGITPNESSTMNINDNVKVDNHVVPELDATYFFTPNIAAELIAAVSPHDITTTGGVDAGTVWLLPPTLTLQYHFNQFESVKPYLGAGINYTHFFGEDPGSLTDAHYKDSVGIALQAGADIPIQGNWYANVDVKKIYIDTNAKFSNNAVRADVDIDPWFVGIGLGYKF
ncbi:MAG: OmpW family outer membrane protein [Alphaproteobacteria bacterium]|nr:OmpW family outer membrane protein [Alphaproteobacteria bacterium]